MVLNLLLTSQTLIIVCICFLAFILLDFKSNVKVKLLLIMAAYVGLRHIRMFYERIQSKRLTQDVTPVQLAGMLQPGDIISTAVMAYDKSINMLVYTNILDNYFHHGIVVEKDGKKYMCHSYRSDFQPTRPDHDPRYIKGELACAGLDYSWLIVCEPLEGYLTYISEFISKHHSNIKVKRTGRHLTFSQEIADDITKQFAEKYHIGITHCCIFVGEYLRRVPGLTVYDKIPYPINHLFMYSPFTLSNPYIDVKQKFYYTLT